MPFTPSRRIDLNIAAHDLASLSVLTLQEKFMSTSLKLLGPSACSDEKALLVHWTF
jgi:hypothetical protein